MKRGDGVVANETIIHWSSNKMFVSNNRPCTAFNNEKPYSRLLKALTRKMLKQSKRNIITNQFTKKEI